ncbi:hypothetical protein ACEWK1_02935 [Metabacillus sp. YM-086]|uniref:hypothetical protein n=1 Tax=Metabacillus sp. YM-086 TaxID=3341729 RepID=UPI003A88BE77
MLTISSNHYEMIHFYNNLLNTIEEGFEYVVSSFTNLELTGGDRIFKDILAAFYHVDSTHKALHAVLQEERELVEEMEKFNEVILALDEESSIFSSLDTHQDFVKNQLFPAYLAWKESIQKQLEPYITH